MIHIAPSILAADFSRLGEQVAEVERAGAQRIHVDVMDGHFVPNLTMGACVVQGLRPRTRLPLEIHLMVEDPGKFVDGFVQAGADTLIIHHEVLPNPLPLLQRIRGLGKKAGLAINPNHPVDELQPYLGAIDLALCMTVFPGFGGQAFLRPAAGALRTGSGRRHRTAHGTDRGGRGSERPGDWHRHLPLPRWSHGGASRFARQAPGKLKG
jgi:ribulose-phosphate 3-epimerase